MWSLWTRHLCRPPPASRPRPRPPSDPAHWMSMSAPLCRPASDDHSAGNDRALAEPEATSPAPQPCHARPFQTFDRWISFRRAQAKRSLVIQVRSAQSEHDLRQYCQEQLGPIRSIRSWHSHQAQQPEAASYFFCVEFESSSSVRLAMEGHGHHDRSLAKVRPIPVYSPFLWFSGKGGSETSKLEKISAAPVKNSDIFYDSEDLESDLLKAVELGELGREHQFDFSILSWYQSSRLSDTSSRIRFLACEQVELAVSGLFPMARVLPFGSSVNSFGNDSSDLDMVVKLDVDQQQTSSSRLLFHAKGEMIDHRLQTQRYCDQFSNLIQNFFPGCRNVQSILHARVPIIKYEHQLLDLECDLSLSSMSGYYMSELLYMYGELDRRVRPLVFMMRKWAKEQGLLLNMRPTPYFTHFSLTLLVIFFLQNQYKMLPTFSQLVQLARPEDRIVCEDGVECTFRRDLHGLQSQLNACLVDSTSTSTQPSLTHLLTDLFAFYGRRFPYHTHAACVVTGQLQPKRTDPKRNATYSLDVVNPLEPELNVSSNVQGAAVHKFRDECRRAQQLLEQMLEQGDKDFGQLFVKQKVSRHSVQVVDLGWGESASPKPRSHSSISRTQVKDGALGKSGRQHQEGQRRQQQQLKVTQRETRDKEHR